MELFILGGLALAALVVFGVVATAVGFVFWLVALPFRMVGWVIGASLCALKCVLCLPLLLLGLCALVLITPFILLAVAAGALW